MVTTGFSPGGGQSGVSKAFVARDAADLLLSSTTNSDSIEASGRGLLLLADGSRYEGDLFGARKVAEGELVFTTNMTGYQESLTDPSFAGQVLTFTWPLLGNYGILPGISESRGARVLASLIVLKHWKKFLILQKCFLQPFYLQCSHDQKMLSNY